jgi:hypothetical protein
VELVMAGVAENEVVEGMLISVGSEAGMLIREMEQPVRERINKLVTSEKRMSLMDSSFWLRITTTMIVSWSQVEPSAPNPLTGGKGGKKQLQLIAFLAGRFLWNKGIYLRDDTVGLA